MKKRLLVILLAAVLIMAAGCKKNSLSPSETQGGEETKITEQQPIDPDEIAQGGNPYYIAEHYEELAASEEAKKAEGEKEETQEVIIESESQSTEASETPEGKVAGATEAPKVTEKPAETQKPAVTQKPAETVKPAETQKPAETKKPAEATEAPKQTSKPAETQKPVETQKPAETPKPADPTPTKAPDPTPTTDPCANGHDWVKKEVSVEPTCWHDGTVVYECTKCGKRKAEGMSKLPHEMEVESHRDGDCVTAAFTRYQCKNCDHFEDEYDDSCVGRDHVYSTGTYQEFDEELLEWVDVTVTKCVRCGLITEKSRSN